jgi:hypothetical protein
VTIAVGPVRVATVASKADLRAFCDLPLRLHPRDRYVPLLSSVIAEHARTAELLLVRDGEGTVVGRTSVHRDAGFDAKIGPHQLFGHTEFVDDDTVFATIVDAIAARAGGLPLFGPVALLPNETGGVITSEFAERGFVDSAWNPARPTTRRPTSGTASPAASRATRGSSTSTGRTRASGSTTRGSRPSSWSSGTRPGAVSRHSCRSCGRC